MGLTACEMTALVGGMRVLGTNHGGTKHGVFTDRVGAADHRLLRQPDRHGLHLEPTGNSYAIRDRKTGATQMDGDRRGPGLRLELGPARLCRGLCPGRQREKFVQDFVAAWTKVMNADRFDLM
jgi:catalase-peroxidase